jgi:hypothetical protein
MPNWLIALLVGGAFGLIMGVFIARKSAKEKSIQGGTLASVFHYLGASAFVAVAPTVLVGSFLYKLHFFPRLIRGIGLGFSLLAVAAVFLILYAIFETQATQSQPKQSPKV